MATLTVEKEESVLRGYVPLGKIQEVLKTGQKIEKIKFPGNGYCTDAVLYQLKQAHAEILSDVKEIDLKGCYLLTDHGLRSLLGVLKNTKNLVKFDLSGCEKLTDNTFAELHTLNRDGHTWSMKCTGVNYMNNTNIGIETKGCPSYGGTGEMHKHGQVLVVPHPDLKHSLSGYLYSGDTTERKSGMHKSDWSVEEWKLAITEVSSRSCLFDSLTNSQLSQVIIPFDASSEPKTIKDHIMSTMARVVAKQPIQNEFPRIKAIATIETVTMSERPFLDMHLLDKLHINEDFVLRNISITDVLIGVYVSHTPLTRSNPYFEVECVEAGSGKTAILIGAMYDLLFSDRHPMDSPAESGGIVDGFETITPGTKIGFGIEGEWVSEYVPGSDCKYFFMEAGVKKKGKDPSANDEPHMGLYPLVSVLGEDFGAVKLPSFVQPPQDTIEAWRKEERWIEQGYTYNLLVDKKGFVSYQDNYNTALGKGLFLSSKPISQLNHSFSVTIEKFDTNKDKPVWIGVVPETFSISKKDVGSYMFWSLGDGIVWGPNAGDRAPLENAITFGDTITVTVSKITGYTGVVSEPMKVDIKFLLNGKMVYEKIDWSYELKHAGLRLVPMVALSDSNSKLKLNNYRPKYRRPAPYPNKVTMGRCHYTNVMDDGEIEFREFKKGGSDRGLFVGKTPFNKEQLEFEVEIKEMTSKKLFAIGVCHSSYPVNQFLGWKQGSVGYHADNGRIYINSSSGDLAFTTCSDETELSMIAGDTVTLRVEPINADTKIQFDQDGHVDSQQVIKLVFLKNSTVIHEVTHEILGDGIYPAVSLQSTGDQFKLKNFYAETNQIWDLVERKKEEKLIKKKDSGLKAEEVEKYKGTEFLIVGVSSGSSDPSGKLQILQQQINLVEGWREREAVRQAIKNYEKNLKSLDLQEQQTYSQLCAILDNMKSLAEDSDRIKYKTIDLSSGSGLGDIKSEIERVQVSHQALQPQRYLMASSVVRIEEDILTSLKKGKILDFKLLIENLSGMATLSLLKEMQSQGKLLLLSCGNETLVADIQFMLDLEERLLALTPTTMVEIGTMLTSIGQSSHVWNTEALEKKILIDVPPEKKDTVSLILEKIFGLIRLPCLRTSPDQQQCVFAIQQNISNPPAPMVEYWSDSHDNTDFAVMSQKYQFPTSFPTHILSLMISNTVNYGHIIILTGEGIVYQNGAVQTVIVKHYSATDDQESIIIESKCYMPDLEKHEDTRISKETVSYVNEYTWNIFCIYTDLIDDILRRENIPVAIVKKVPPGLVNVSVGCKHSWIHKGDNVMQTVCTLCNKCCDKGANCEWSGIMGKYLRHCGCGTTNVGCRTCGICGFCADELWSVRSRLRPFATSTTEVKQTITEKTAKKTGTDEEKEKDANGSMMLRDPVQQPIIPLDPFLYNEMEFINLSSQHKILCMREESDGTTLQAFPGKACYIQDLSKVSLTRTYDSHYKLNVGDHIKIKLTDPLGASYLNEDEVETKETLKVEPQYFAFFGRESKIIHETGIVLYDTSSSSIPVAQFIGCRPMTKDHNTFSIRVLKTGKGGSIAMGLVPKNYPPNRQPGWNVQSIGYHADDGGIYLESGWPTRKTKVAKEGDIMSFYVDMDKNKGFFRKNGEQCIELNLNPSKLGYYPCVAMHSVGEAVQLLEKSFWEPVGIPDSSLEPPAFPTYKYGNLWISPGQKVTMTKLQSNVFSGWLTLHNPSKDPVGFKVVYGKKAEQKIYGVLEYKKDWLEHLDMPKADLRDCILVEWTSLESADLRDCILVEWTSLESGRKYETSEMKLLFGEGEEVVSQSSHQHKLSVAVQESSSIVEELPSCTTEPAEKSVLCMQVYRNLSLIDEYWLKYGNYHLTVETKSKDADFLLKYPKCPSFQYAQTFQKGMRLTMKLENSNTYAECIIVEVYNGGKMLALEYSPKDSNVNSTVCVLANSPALRFTEFKGDSEKVGETEKEDSDSDTVLVYHSRYTPVSLTRTFVWTPPYLLSEGNKQCMQFLDQEWKANTLRAVSQCSQVFTRLTVQEQSINNASNNMLDWVKFESSYHYCYLPNQLSVQNLAYPQVHTMFTDLGVHRMCFPSEEILSPVIEQFKLKNEKWRIPLHFVDIPGITPSSSIPLDSLWSNNRTAWCYTSLISSKLYLPLYDMMISGDKNTFSRPQIEHLLFNMLQTYTSLCGIYNAHLGGIEYSELNDNAGLIPQLIKHDDKHIVKFAGKPITENNVLVKTTGTAMCKAHVMNVAVDEFKYPGSLNFSYDYFDPYFDHVTTFAWMHSKVTEFPSDFFEKFKRLQVFQLIGMVSLEALPQGISKVEGLKVVEVSNTAMKELPDDFFMTPSAVSMTCTDMPVRKLPTKFLEDSEITDLILAGLLLRDVPKELSNLKSLETLELCYNSITDLPEEMMELKKLRNLKLLGCPWITLQGNKTQMTYEQYISWMHGLNPFIKNTLGEEKIEKLFHAFDYNHNGSLDEEELAGLNCHLFFDIARLGLKDLNDEVTGGIPSVIFSMKSLNQLHLDYQAITMVPQAINNLQNLNTLSLSHNPLLESLPGSLGHLPNIKSINLQSCPMLRTPPNEVVGRGFESVKAYLKRLAGGFTECRRTKLMVVGLGGAGKTSLLRALMSEKKMTSGTEKEIPTDGIDIVPWTIASEDGTEVTYSTWDFAGQAVYYNTHQFFLSKRAVYLLLWSMRQGYEHAGLDFWLSSISCHAPNTPILVIGTQCDLIPKAEIPEKELMERYPQIAGFHQVSSVKGTGVAELQKNLLNITLQQGYMGEKIPQVWLNFEKRILAERLTKKSYLKWDVARGYAMEAGIYDEKDVRLAVQLLHDLGTLQYFDNDFLQDYVVINPQWIVDVMACVVSAQDSSIQKHKGRFLHADIPEIWQDYSEELRPWLLRLTEDFDLTFPLPKEPVNVVPCLLPGEQPEDLKWPSIRTQAGVRETKMVYRFHYLPSGLFNRAQVRLFQFSDGKQVWKKGSLLSKNNHLALIKQTDSKELVVLVQGPRPENILFLIHEVFESIIEESFNGVSYELFVPCPDCILKEGTYDPCLFNSHLIERANGLKAPFLQCSKFFHMISMAQLQEKMPTDSRDVSDFDVQLQQSLVALQELDNELTMDTAIIYCSEDVPKPGDTNTIPPSLIRDDLVDWGYQCEGVPKPGDTITIPPSLIRDDLVDWGYQCWFPDDMDNISEIDLTTAIKNCKVLIVIMSDQFEKNAKCRDMLIYAKEILNKDILVVVSGESMEWQSKDIGMKIGAQERKLMVKTLKRYMVEGGRRNELREWMEEKHQQHKGESLLPDVFISYSWSNSHSAAEKSGKFGPGALGWADPRQIKAVLQEAGIRCWIDIEMVGKEKKGIYADMAAGIRKSKLMLACISDEYADSDNCMMELRFGILNMDLPLVVAVVGTGNNWKETEVAMLLRRAKAPEVYLQKENPEGFNSLVKFVKEKLLSIQLSDGSKKKKEKKSAPKKGKDKQETGKQSNIAYQEEYELLQRKFMRHILKLNVIAPSSEPLPRLVIADFVKVVKAKPEHEGRTSSTMVTRRTIRPKTATRSRDRLQVDADLLEEDDFTDWQSESFCLKVLCEHEEGWHMCNEMYPLAFRNRELLETFFKKAAPYLYRMYSILKQSPVKLKCFASGKGNSFQKWIREESDESADFVGAMIHLQSGLINDDAANVRDCIARCRLPSGRIVWLCKKHQGGEHVAKLSTSSTGGTGNFAKVLFNEDKLLRENIEKYDTYKRLKGKKSKKVAPKLPPPVPVPAYEPQISTQSEPDHEKQQDKEVKKEETKKEEKKEEGKKEEAPVKKPDQTVKQPPLSPPIKDQVLSPPPPPASQTQVTKQPPPVDGKEVKEQGISQDETTANKMESQELPKQEENQSSKTDIQNQSDKSEPQIQFSTTENQSENKIREQSRNKTEKDVKNKEKTKNIKHLDSKLFATQELPDEERIEERESVQYPSSTSTDNQDGSSFSEEKRRESIKMSVINKMSRESKANKATPSKLTAFKKLQSRNVTKTENERTYTLPRGNSKGTLLKGSNIARSNVSSASSSEAGSKPAPKARSSTNSRWTWDDPQLATALTIQKVNKGADDIMSEPSKAPPNTAANDKSRSGDKSSIEKVHPKRIVVKPKEGPNDKGAVGRPSPQRKASVTVTGTGIGSSSSPDRPLPERTPSKACTIQ